MPIQGLIASGADHHTEAIYVRGVVDRMTETLSGGDFLRIKVPDVDLTSGLPFPK